MPDFESIYELEQYLNKGLEKAMDTISKDISKNLNKDYKDLWYNRASVNLNDTQSPTYKRTNQLLKGVGTRKYIFDNTQNKQFQYEIGFYGTRIKPKYDRKRIFNAYMSLDKSVIWGGIPITEAIAWWIEKGTSSPHYSMPAKHIFQKTAKEYNREKVETKIKNMLQRQGVGFA